MKTDLEIKQDVLAELNWLPHIDETQIGVTVNNGIVTLTGTVSNYPKKRIIDRAVRRISGVKAVAEEVIVKYGDSDKNSDIEIAKTAVNALELNTSVLSENILLKVEDGKIYLTGELEWAYQKKFAEIAIEHLYGVKEVINNIQIIPKTTPTDVKDSIERAYKRSANIDAKQIKVNIDGYTITLSGTVHSIKEKDDAQIAAYNAAGITDVKNELKVEYDPIYM